MELNEKLLAKLRELSEKPEGWGDIRIIEPADARAILAALPTAATAAPKTMAEVLDAMEKIKTDPALLEQLRAAAQADECASNEIAWESTTPGYRKYITESTYQRFSPEIRAWYKPFRCSNCATATLEDQPDEQAAGRAWFKQWAGQFEGSGETLTERGAAKEAARAAWQARAAKQHADYVRLQSDYEALKSLCSRAETAAAVAHVELKKFREATGCLLARELLTKLAALTSPDLEADGLTDDEIFAVLKTVRDDAVRLPKGWLEFAHALLEAYSVKQRLIAAARENPVLATE